MFIVGQNKTIEDMKKGAYDNFNFFIIVGPKNYGKTYLTKLIANHYNMNYILLNNKVDSIRSLVDSSGKNNNCLYHLKDFEKSSAAAKAALLKIAEETPKGIKIIITTNSSNILETLKSRALIINVANYNAEEILKYNNILEMEESILNELIVKYKNNLTPSLLEKYKKREDIKDIIDLVNKTINDVNNGLKLEDMSLIANNFWKDDLDKITIYLNILSNSVSEFKDSVIYRSVIIEKTIYRLNTISLSNYRNLIHDMLMEMI